ncbi:MAG: multicopper oxidase domain-containing protein [Planctomycetota bacterium]|jgi:spore coat protein A
MKRLSTIIILAGAAALLAAPARADVVEIPAAKDNTLYQKSDGSLSNGAGEYIFAGNTDQGTDEWTRRAVLMFDIAASIPAGSTINSVTLRLYMSRAKENIGYTTSLHPLTQDWGEGTSVAGGNEGAGTSAEQDDATWLYRFYDENNPEGSPAWTSEGGDFASASASQSVGGTGFYTWGSTLELEADVQAWLDSPATNFGWILIGNETTSKTAKRFNSRQFGGQTTRLPKLTVDFTPAVPTSACCLLDGSCITVTAQADCDAAGGTFEGFGTDCGTTVCPQPAGACCLSGGTCNELIETDCLAQGGLYQGDLTTCQPDTCPLFLEPYVDALTVPPLAQPITGAPGDVAEYDMAIRETQQQVHRDLPPTTVWGYDDGTSGPIWPGPTILAGYENAVTVNWINDLRYSSGPNQGLLRQEHYLPVDLCPHGPDHEGDTARTVTHLHGGHVPSRFDGYPEATILPGEMVQYVYNNDQLGATIWYHDHALGITRLNVQMGLAGAYVIQDATDLSVNLPAGEFDVPLILQDRTFNRDGTISYPPVWQDHFFGEFALVNGTVQPFLQVTRGKYRFRIVNGCNSRQLTLTLSNGAPLVVIAGDGGLHDEPSPPLPEITMGPGERVEVIVDFESYADGTEILLANTLVPTLPGATPLPAFMKFIVQGGGGDTDPLPATLRTNEVLQEGDAIQTRDFELRKDPDSTPDCSTTWWLINGLTWNDITEYPELDTIEIWQFINPSGQMHPMHMHLVFFQVLDHTPITVGADGTVTTIGPASPPSPTEVGWKDTVQVMPQTMTRVIARFEDYAGKYAYHCHILEHEDHEMMRQFLSVIPCPEDTDRNGSVDIVDLLDLLALWGDCPEPCSLLGEVQDPDTCPGDTNRDCVVDIIDLLNLLAAWGPCS